MRVGEVLLFLLFNAGLIFGLYFWQTRLWAEKLKRVRQEIQELEDLVVAIVEEFGEAVAAAPNTNVDAQSNENSHQKLIANNQRPIPDFHPENPELAVNPKSELLSEQVPKPKPKPKSKVISKPQPEVELETLAGSQAKEVREKIQPQPLKSKIISDKLRDEPMTLNLASEAEVKQELIPPPKPKRKAKAKANPKPATKSFTQPVSPVQNTPANQNFAEMVSHSASKPSFPLSGNTSVTKRRQQVLNLAQQGLEVTEIARQLKMGQGEIQLILGLNKRPNNNG
jgi:hypothetical protein